MGRVLNEDERLEAGDVLYLDGRIWLTVDGLAGDPVSDHTSLSRGTYAMRPSEKEPPDIGEALAKLQKGLDVIREELWR